MKKIVLYNPQGDLIYSQRQKATRFIAGGGVFTIRNTDRCSAYKNYSESQEQHSGDIRGKTLKLR